MTPPGLLGVALLFWGWQTGFVVVGLVMAALVEGRFLVRSRWDLSRVDFNRVSDISAVLLVLIAVYQFVGTDAARAVLSILEWLPLTVFPLVVCQIYSSAGAVDLSIFFWSLRGAPTSIPTTRGGRWTSRTPTSRWPCCRRAPPTCARARSSPGSW